ncbi:MAG: epimerase [Spirochaetes bacterium]|nr:MAG: epimerase [Spirochaetota bacterium]
MVEFPEKFDSEEELDDFISEPSAQLIDLCRNWKGPTVVLGIAGKMGYHLGMMLVKARDRSGSSGEIIGVSRFSDSEARRKVEEAGIRTVAADLLSPDAAAGLPDAQRVVYMVGRKFGTAGSEELTWAVNTLIPQAVCRRYAGIPIVVYSTGAVYPRVPLESGGADESLPLTPLGEYANAAVGRERIFQYMSGVTGTPICLVRLFYAIDLRYGVLRDIGEKVASGETVDLNMGYVNVIWQGDAVNQSLLAFSQCAIPPRPLNVTGPEIISIRDTAERFAELLGRRAKFSGTPATDALLGKTDRTVGLFGPPRVSVEKMIVWVAEWIKAGGRGLNKPTHFETRNGDY